MFQIKSTGQQYMQVSHRQINTWLCHFSLRKFSRVKATAHLTPRVSLSFSQKSSSGPNAMRAEEESERSPGPQEFGMEESSTPRAGRRASSGPGRGDATGRSSPPPGPRPPLCGKGGTCPDRGGRPDSVWRGKPHFSDPAPRRPRRAPRGRYLTAPLLREPSPRPAQPDPARGQRAALPGTASARRRRPGRPGPAAPAPTGARAPAARPSPSPRPRPRARPRLPPPIPPSIPPPSPPPHCGARSTCPGVPRAAPRHDPGPQPHARPRGAVATRSPAPGPRRYLVGVGGQEDVELGFRRSVHVGPESAGRAPRAARRGREEREKWASLRSVA